MKKIGLIISDRKPKVIQKWDAKSIFFVLQKVLKEEFGNQGVARFASDHWTGSTLCIKSDSSVWSNELWINRSRIIRKINQELGVDEVKEIKIDKK